MRIAYVVPEFPGQTHAFFWREILHLRKLGVQLKLISTRHPPRALISHDWAEQAISETTYLARLGPLSVLGSLWEILRSQNRMSLAKNALSSPKILAATLCAGRLARIARHEELTHAHSHSCGNSALIAMLAKKIMGLRYSLTLHGPLEDYGDQQSEKFREADFATTITESLKQSIRDQLGDAAPRRIGIAPMGIDLDRFKRSEAFISWSGGPLRLFSCGRLNLIKGHQDTIQAVRLLRARGIDARLTIAGEDDAGGSGFRSTLIAAIEDLPVTLLGAVSEARIVTELERSHFFVLASWREPLGVAIMEAMSCGVPVISTNAGGVPELIEDGKTGILVQPREPTMLADAIEHLMHDKFLQETLSRLGRERAEESFSSERSARELFRLLCASHNPYVLE